MNMTYELYFNHQESEEAIPADVQLDRYVAIMNSGENTVFDLRFPVKGIYKLIVLDDETWLAFFKIVCGEPKEKCEPYPVNAEIGFGPCTETEKAGMKPETHKTGVIVVRQMKRVEVKFSLQRSLLVQTRLVHNNINSEQLQQHVSHTVKNKQLIVNVGVPSNGEYALQINTKEKGSNQDYNNACNYLLSSDDPKKKKRDYEVC